MTEPRVLVRMPTRSRPQQALRVLERYRKMAGYPIAIEVVIDDDDMSMHHPDVLASLKALDCTVFSGPHASKVEACNSGAWDAWDVLLLASDDMIPVANDYAAQIVEAMHAYFPYLDGAVYFDDGYAGERTCTCPAIGRRLYQSFSTVYAPEYRSLWCDNEQTELLRAMHRIAYVPKLLIEHAHPVTKKSNPDPLYARNDALWGEDKATYERRLAMRRPHAQFPFDAPPLWLSIGICTIDKRRAMLDGLLTELWRQIHSAAPRKVEVLIDGGDGTIGEKRQRILNRALGHFVCFIDDDDWIVPAYIARIIGAIEREPDVDCVSLNGVITTNGQNPQMFLHSKKYPTWTGTGPYLRSPNHLNPCRRALALKVGFPPISHGEDSDYSMRLLPLLRSEADSGDAHLYEYRWIPHK